MDAISQKYLEQRTYAGVNNGVIDHMIWKSSPWENIKCKLHVNLFRSPGVDVHFNQKHISIYGIKHQE